MKINLSELRTIVEGLILEAKKKKKAKKGDANPLAGTAGGAYGSYAPAFDFSKPLGPANLYKAQGQVNWGPQTSVPDEELDDKVSGMGELDEDFVRAFVRSVIQEETELSESVWDQIEEATEKSLVPTENPWEQALQSLVKKDKK